MDFRTLKSKLIGEEVEDGLDLMNMAREAGGDTGELTDESFKGMSGEISFVSDAAEYHIEDHPGWAELEIWPKDTPGICYEIYAEEDSFEDTLEIKMIHNKHVGAEK